MAKITRSIKEVNKAGALLVFALKGKEDPDSLWHRLHPRTKMRWDWDETGDDRVVDLWHMMKVLSESKEVVYSKWFQNRATFFSKDCFTALVCYLSKTFYLERGLLLEAQEILENLESDSPLSTKEIKELTGLKGRFNESLYNKAMKQLYQRGLIVGFGEKDDGAFPSALMGATRLLFEELHREAQSMDLDQAHEILNNTLRKSPAFKRQLLRIERELQLKEKGKG